MDKKLTDGKPPGWVITAWCDELIFGLFCAAAVMMAMAAAAFVSRL